MQTRLGSKNSKLSHVIPQQLTSWNPYLEPRNLPEPLLGTLTCLEPSLKTFRLETWNLLHTWNPDLKPRNFPKPTWRNLLEPLPATLTVLGTVELPETFPLLRRPFWNLHLELLLLDPLLGTLPWNHLQPLLEPRNLPEPSLGTFSCLEFSLKTIYLEPPRSLEALHGTSKASKPLLATLTRNLGTSRKACGMTAPECPRFG